MFRASYYRLLELHLAGVLLLCFLPTPALAAIRQTLPSDRILTTPLLTPRELCFVGLSPEGLPVVRGRLRDNPHEARVAVKRPPDKSRI